MPKTEHAIRDDENDAAHKDDVHFNPAKHRLVVSAAWPHSTFKSCAQRGLYQFDRISTDNNDIQAGEPDG